MAGVKVVHRQTLVSRTASAFGGNERGSQPLRSRVAHGTPGGYTRWNCKRVRRRFLSRARVGGRAFKSLGWCGRRSARCWIIPCRRVTRGKSRSGGPSWGHGKASSTPFSKTSNSGRRSSGIEPSGSWSGFEPSTAISVIRFWSSIAFTRSRFSRAMARFISPISHPQSWQSACLRAMLPRYIVDAIEQVMARDIPTNGTSPNRSRIVC